MGAPATVATREPVMSPSPVPLGSRPVGRRSRPAPAPTTVPGQPARRATSKTSSALPQAGSTARPRPGPSTPRYPRG
ncbi:hypothetical protein I551_1214 [Mycobacterium ulcerans str. Harvey]|uniref:Uncharacterized protein n=1 Tax=Mycobacterium ulcerans str. Harvey TaxID=1299332 RepID=A0ABN0R5K5_MYCUL|nr:hypothetical protein I551_1214 [Mycobacterium ulcerans str. Harvey]